jgi:hypothetical protein
MGNLIKELESRGIHIRQTNQFFIGYKETEQGIRVIRSRTERGECDEAIYFLDNGKGKIIPFNTSWVILLSGTEYEGVTDQEEVSRLAEEGKVFSFLASGLYAEWYGFAEKPDLESVFRYGYSRRSRDYIEGVMKDIGMAGYEEGYMDPEQLDGNSTISILQYDVQTGKAADGRWVAQAAYRYSADGFGLVKMYFDHEATPQQVTQGFLIREFNKDPEETFRCGLCGKRTHWLDLDGGIQDRMRHWESGICDACRELG